MKGVSKLREYIGIGDKKVSVSDQVYDVLIKMDKKNGLISSNSLDILDGDKNIDVKLINTEKINDKNINIYGLSIDNGENFEIVKVL